jgi:hypothetical protein
MELHCAEVIVMCDGVNRAVFQLIALFGLQLSQNKAKNKENKQIRTRRWEIKERKRMRKKKRKKD